MPDLKVFTYLPNPRLAKVLIAAEYSGAMVEVVGDKPPNLLEWLWDFDARELSESEKETQAFASFARPATVGFKGYSLYKSDAFMEAHPFGNVPAGFSHDGKTGVFESNSIMRAAARCGPKDHSLLGEGAFGESRVDAFLDRTLVFARDAQRYLLAKDALTAELHAETNESLHAFFRGLEQALSRFEFVASNTMSLADIAVICELCLLSNESRYETALRDMGLELLLPSLSQYDALTHHVAKLSHEPPIAKHLAGYLDTLLSAWG